MRKLDKTLLVCGICLIALGLLIVIPFLLGQAPARASSNDLASMGTLSIGMGLFFISADYFASSKLTMGQFRMCFLVLGSILFTAIALLVMIWAGQLVVASLLTFGLIAAAGLSLGILSVILSLSWSLKGVHGYVSPIVKEDYIPYAGIMLLMLFSAVASICSYLYGSSWILGVSSVISFIFFFLMLIALTQKPNPVFAFMTFMLGFITASSIYSCKFDPSWTLIVSSALSVTLLAFLSTEVIMMRYDEIRIKECFE